MWLTDEVFRQVVQSAPLISIDLVVEADDKRILLGQRLNRPAQGSWFVPGGRIHKNESLVAAFQRIVSVELGGEAKRNDARLLGVFEHFYQDSVFGAEPDTHYIVLAYALPWKKIASANLPQDQHGLFRWWTLQEAVTSEEVHPYTRAYIPLLN